MYTTKYKIIDDNGKLKLISYLEDDKDNTEKFTTYSEYIAKNRFGSDQNNYVIEQHNNQYHYIPKGSQGPQGPYGISGVQGTSGAQGPSGLDGFSGSAGYAGVSYNSIFTGCTSLTTIGLPNRNGRIYTNEFIEEYLEKLKTEQKEEKSKYNSLCDYFPTFT